MYKDKKRFDFDIDNHKDAVGYIKNRATQLLRFGAKLIEIQKYKEAVVGIFEYKKSTYQSIYILKSFRKNNHFQKIHSLNKMPILVCREDKIEDFLKNKGYDYKLIVVEDSNPYVTISKYLGDEVTWKSKKFKMDHIDEGLAIMEIRNASKYAKSAFCLHPMMQDDCDLRKHRSGKGLSLPDSMVPMRVLINVMDFRSVANEYKLFSYPRKKIKSVYDIRKSPLKDVDEMLIADKVQDRKDFEVYGVYGDEKDHAEYFKNWLERLDIKDVDYKKYKESLIINPKIIDNTGMDIKEEVEPIQDFEFEYPEDMVSNLATMGDRLPFGPNFLSFI